MVTEKEIRITQQIQFEFNKAVIKPGISYKILDEVVGVLDGQSEDQPRGAGAHRQRRRGRVQHESVAERALTQCVRIS